MLNKEVLESIFEKLLSQAKKSYDEFNAAIFKWMEKSVTAFDLGVTILNGLEEVNNNKQANFKELDMGSWYVRQILCPLRICSQALR